MTQFTVTREKISQLNVKVPGSASKKTVKVVTKQRRKFVKRPYRLKDLKRLKWWKSLKKSFPEASEVSCRRSVVEEPTAEAPTVLKQLNVNRRQRLCRPVNRYRQKPFVEEMTAPVRKPEATKERH